MSHFLQELAQRLTAVYSNDLSSLVVMLPSLRARTFFNSALAELSDRPVWQPSWMSIDEAMEQISGLIRGERIRLISELYKMYVKHHFRQGICRVIEEENGMMCRSQFRQWQNRLH